MLVLMLLPCAVDSKASLLGALNFFTENLSTLVYITIEDTMQSYREYQMNRLEYDAERIEFDKVRGCQMLRCRTQLYSVVRHMHFEVVWCVVCGVWCVVCGVCYGLLRYIV